MSELRLKNTYSKALETFRPNDPAGRIVTMYTCGPTVYSNAHVGNFRSFLLGDVLRRVLERRGYVVRQVMNITDVGHMTEDHLADASGEDKLSKAARELGSDPYKVAEYFERLFVEDAKILRLRNYSGADANDLALHPRATRHVPEMLVMIQALLDRGFAYLDPRGQVYFEVSKFPEYGALSGKIIDELESGSRVAVREEKRDPRDFALWKVDEKHLMKWDPHGPEGWPAGDYERFRALAPDGVDAGIRPGFPGWHVECSAMARAHLGATIDIHTGGEDNIFPHHECEIAQSYGAHGDCTPGPNGEGRKSFARFWVHGRHLLVDNRKMSKRDGTFFTLRDLLDPRASGRADLAERLEAAEFPGGRVPAAVLRYALICNPYLQPMNFGFDLLAQAKSSVERLQSRYERLREIVATGMVATETSGDPPVEWLERHVREFDAALDDNLNMPNALGALFGLVSELNQAELSAPTARSALNALEGIDDVLAVLDRRVRSGVLASDRVKSAAESGTVAPFAAEAEQGELDAEGVERLIVLRHAARARKDFAQADAVRNNLKARGVVIEDTPAGVRWKLT